MRKYTDTQQKSYAAGRRKRNARKPLPVRVIKMKVKRGDTVEVITGKDKGKKGEVSRVLPKENRVVIDGVNVVKRSLRRTGTRQSGRIIERPAPIHASNVRVVTKKSK